MVLQPIIACDKGKAGKILYIINKMKKLLIILLISSLSSFLFGQSDTVRFYGLSDTSLWVNKRFIIDNIIFKLSGSTDYLVHNPESLNSIITFLIKNPKLIVEIGCHTDNRPVPFTNDTLSLRRANSVKSYLTFMGIMSDRIVAIGYGSRRPRIISEQMT